jgi:predicted glycosyltransferase
MGNIKSAYTTRITVARPKQRNAQNRAPRVVLYSHDTLGFGHLRRNMLLAAALKECEPAPDILLIAGMREAGAFAMPAGVDCISLPAYAKSADGSYQARDLGVGIEALGDIRAATIRAAVENFQPDLMVVDNVPRGAQFELDPALKSLRRSGKTRVVLGLRDIIDRPAVMRQQWLRQRNFEALREFYSEIWVYGDPAVYASATEYGLGPELSALVTYTGYLDQAARLKSKSSPLACKALIGDDPRPYVLCSVGGGRDGVALSNAFVQAQMPEDHRGILITGTQMDAADRRRIKQSAAKRSDMTVVEFVQEPAGLAAGAAATVSMCGYNTACEVMSLGLRALIVPRVRPRAEQLIRAERLSALGIADMLHPDDLSSTALADWLALPSSLGGRRAAVDLNGLARVQKLAEPFLEAPSSPRRAS